MSKERGNEIPLTIEIPINYTINENGNFILEYDTMQDDFADKMKSLDSYLVKLKQRIEEKKWKQKS